MISFILWNHSFFFLLLSFPTIFSGIKQSGEEKKRSGEEAIPEDHLVLKKNNVNFSLLFSGKSERIKISFILFTIPFLHFLSDQTER